MTADMSLTNTVKLCQLIEELDVDPALVFVFQMKAICSEWFLDLQKKGVTPDLQWVLDEIAREIPENQKSKFAKLAAEIKRSQG